jgi:hypothetical protein
MFDLQVYLEALQVDDDGLRPTKAQHTSLFANQCSSHTPTWLKDSQLRKLLTVVGLIITLEAPAHM